MSRYIYGNNGRPLNRDIDMAEVLGEYSESSQSMDIGDSVVGSRVARLDRLYMTLAGAIMGRMKNDALHMRRLASGLLVYTTKRHVHLEPGIEATLPEDDTLAFNWKDLLEPPRDQVPEPLGFEHTRWVAQQLIDFDYGVQDQQRKRANRDY